jgi:hypothetical protein
MIVDTCSLAIILKILIVWYLLLGGAFFIYLLPLAMKNRKNCIVCVKFIFFWLPYLIKWGRER